MSSKELMHKPETQSWAYILDNCFLDVQKGQTILDQEFLKSLLVSIHGMVSVTRYMCSRTDDSAEDLGYGDSQFPDSQQLPQTRNTT
jgi:hypothetical protein